MFFVCANPAVLATTLCTDHCIPSGVFFSPFSRPTFDVLFWRLQRYPLSKLPKKREKYFLLANFESSTHVVPGQSFTLLPSRSYLHILQDLDSVLVMSR